MLDFHNRPTKPTLWIQHGRESCEVINQSWICCFTWAKMSWLCSNSIIGRRTGFCEYAFMSKAIQTAGTFVANAAVKRARRSFSTGCWMWAALTTCAHFTSCPKDWKITQVASKCFQSVSEVKNIFDSKGLCSKQQTTQSLPSAKTEEAKRGENVNRMLSSSYPVHPSGMRWTHPGPVH